MGVNPLKSKNYTFWDIFSEFESHTTPFSVLNLLIRVMVSLYNAELISVNSFQ